MSFDLDQECRHAKERLRVSIEANTAYELKKMQEKYAKHRLTGDTDYDYWGASILTRADIARQQDVVNRHIESHFFVRCNGQYERIFLT